MDNKKKETETITMVSSDKGDPESEHLERKKAKAMADKSPRQTGYQVTQNDEGIKID